MEKKYKKDQFIKQLLYSLMRSILEIMFQLRILEF